MLVALRVPVWECLPVELTSHSFFTAEHPQLDTY